MSDDTVVKLQLVEVGEGFKFDADAILEAAKGQGFINVVIIAEREGDEDDWLSSSINAGQTLILLERAKMQIIGK